MIFCVSYKIYGFGIQTSDASSFLNLPSTSATTQVAIPVGKKVSVIYINWVKMYSSEMNVILIFLLMSPLASQGWHFSLDTILWHFDNDDRKSLIWEDGKCYSS